MRHRPLQLALAAAVAACGGDDSTTAPDTTPVAVTSFAAGCPDTELDFVNDDAGVTGVARAAVASRSADGAVYVTHVADFDISPDDVSTWRPSVPEGGNVITVQLTMFNAPGALDPLEAPATLRWTSQPGELTFLVRHFTATADWSSVEVTGDEVDRVGGELSVTHVGDAFCFHIDDQDPHKTVSGTVRAAVIEE